MRISIFIILTAFAFADTTQSVAPSPVKNKKIKLYSLDSNSDNKISLQEFVKYKIDKRDKKKLKGIYRDLKDCDLNNDGSVSIIEVKESKSSNKKCGLPVEVFKAVDLNSDGSITKEEAVNFLHPSYEIEKRVNNYLKILKNKSQNSYFKDHFKKCDKDKDSFLTLREATSRVCSMNSDDFFDKDVDKDDMLSLKEMLNRSISEHKSARRMLKTKYFQESEGSERLSIAIKSCDFDNDGFLSLNEANDQDCGVDQELFKVFDINNDKYIGSSEQRDIRFARHFKRYDKNKDGFIDKKEFDKVPDYML